MFCPQPGEEGSDRFPAGGTCVLREEATFTCFYFYSEMSCVRACVKTFLESKPEGQ